MSVSVGYFPQREEIYLSLDHLVLILDDRQKGTHEGQDGPSHCPQRMTKLENQCGQQQLLLP